MPRKTKPGAAREGRMKGKAMPSFRRPPVIETVLGVQFEPLRKMTNAHLGAFWKTLGPEWMKVRDVPSLEPELEFFGDEQTWGQFGGRLKLTSDPASRIQVRNDTEDRMIQVQNGRLHYNWLGTAGREYPRYTHVRPEFDKIVKSFRDFLSQEDLGQMRPNQWEVTYVNHLPKGSVWETPGDWASLFSSLPAPQASVGAAALESFGGQWHYRIGAKSGRLHVAIKHGRRTVPDEREILILTLTARGPIDPDLGEGETLESGIELGRETIVRMFAELTSDAAHKYWGAENGK